MWGGEINVENCRSHEVPVLVAACLLKPLGNPPPNSVKFFAASEVLEQVKDRTWLAKVTKTLNLRWQKKKASKKAGSAELVPPLKSADLVP
jgi:hypothetical protein